MRCKTLRAPSGEHLDRIVGYYAGLAEDQQRRGGRARGPVDYYLDPDEPPGRWWGAGCVAVGLVGEVEGDQLRNMLVARHPLTGRKLGRGYGKRSARSFDATFSAPKSVSLLWGLCADPWVRAEVLAAHDAAVSSALSWLAGHGAPARLGTGGPHQVDTRGLVAAVFRQHTSRTADPSCTPTSSSGPSPRREREVARPRRPAAQGPAALDRLALRRRAPAELTARLGVVWGELEGGQADLVAVPEGLCEAFSKRSAQVEARLAEVLRRWVDDHDGAEPNPRTLAALERDAVLKSRPKKPKVTDAERCGPTGSAKPSTPATACRSCPRSPPARPGGGRPGEVIDEALRRVAQQDSSWLQADLMREVSTLVPADAAPSAEALVALVDDLATEAAGRCTELHPPGTGRHAVPGRRAASHRGGHRPASSPLRPCSTRSAGCSTGPTARCAGAVHPAGSSAARRSTTSSRRSRGGGRHRPGGAGGRACRYRQDRGRSPPPWPASEPEARRSSGGPSGKAADVLAAEAGCRSVTLAKLLLEHERSEPSPALQLPRGSTVLLDEAGMASTEDLDRLVTVANRRQWRLVFVGDPDQLPAVGRGGMFAAWCDTLPVHRLEQVRRFTEPWQADASRGTAGR
jgi:hypothetical protein